MAVLSTIFTGLKLLGIGGGWIRNMRKDSLDFKLRASETENEGERIRLENKAKIIDMQLDDYADARGKASGLPYPLIWCMTATAGMSTLWFAAGVLRSLYGYAEINPLDAEIYAIVRIVFGFLFGGGMAVAAANRYNSNKDK